MRAIHRRFLLRSYVVHKSPENLRLHVVTSCIGWLALTTALSQVPLPFAWPADLGTLFVALAVAYWLLADFVATAAVAALTTCWAMLPGSPWGPGHGWAGVALLGVFVAMAGIEHYAHVYHHEHAAFMNGDPPLARALEAAHETIFGAFHFVLIAMLRLGHRPSLRAGLDALERDALRTRRLVPWDNWARLAPCRAAYVATPQTIDELVQAVVEARARGQGVRVVASGFSWSTLCRSDQTLIFCERLDGIEIDRSDPERPAVWVEAGVTNRKLNRELARHGLCMPWNVVLETVRVAGIASSGTHGTGRATSTVGDLVDAFEIIDAQGRVRVFSDATVGAEVMSAVRLGLGLFGVIARLRLRVAPLYRVRQTDRRVPVRAVLDDLPTLVAQHDSVELYWFPFNRDIWIRTIDRTTEPRTFHGHGLGFKTQNLLQNAFITVASKVIQRVSPGLTPGLLRVGMHMLPFRTRVLDLPESHHYHHWIEMMPAGCLEVGFKVDAGYANVRRAFDATERILADYARRGLYPLNLTLNVRFVGSSSALLTPAYGEGITCYVEIMWMGRPKGWAELSSELCREWLKEPGALPHWSKEFEHVEDVVAIVRTNLGDRRRRFLELLAQTGVDPEHSFANAMLRRVFLDEPPTSS